MQLLHYHIQLVQFGIPLLYVTNPPLHMLNHLLLLLFLVLTLNRWLEVYQVVGQHLGGTDRWTFVGGDGRYVVRGWGYFGLVAVVGHCVES